MSGGNLDNSGECPNEANRRIQEDESSQNQMEVVPPVSPSSPTLLVSPTLASPVSQSSQVATFAIQSIPFNQLLSEADSISKSQVNSEPPDSISESQVNYEPHLKVLLNRVTRGIPRVNYEHVLNSKTKCPMVTLCLTIDYQRNVNLL